MVRPIGRAVVRADIEAVLRLVVLLAPSQAVEIPLLAQLVDRPFPLGDRAFGIGKGGFDVKAALFWTFVGIPLAWGVWKTLESAVKIL